MDDNMPRMDQPAIKIKFPHFAGTKGEQINCFFSKFEKVATFYNIPELDKVTFLGLHLEKCALLYYDRLTSEQDELLTYDHIKHNFLLRYDDKDIKFVRQSRLYSRKQNDDETVRHFYDDILKNSQEISNSELLFIFLKGLKKEIRMHVACKNPQNMQEAFKFANMYEQIKLLNKENTIINTKANCHASKTNRSSTRQRNKYITSTHSRKDKYPRVNYNETRSYHKTMTRKRLHTYTNDKDCPPYQVTKDQDYVICNTAKDMSKNQNIGKFSIKNKNNLATRHFTHRLTEKTVKNRPGYVEGLSIQKLQHRNKTLNEIRNYFTAQRQQKSQINNNLNLDHNTYREKDSKILQIPKNYDKRYKENQISCQAIIAIPRKHVYNNPKRTQQIQHKEKALINRKPYFQKSSITKANNENIEIFDIKSKHNFAPRHFRHNLVEKIVKKRPTHEKESSMEPKIDIKNCISSVMSHNENIEQPNNQNVHKYNTIETSKRKGQSNELKNLKISAKQSSPNIIKKLTEEKIKGIASSKTKSLFSSGHPRYHAKQSYKNKITHRNKTLEEIRSYFKVKDTFSKHNIPIICRPTPEEKNNEILENLNYYIRSNEEKHLLKDIIKKSSDEISKMEAQLKFQNKKLKLMMDRNEEIQRIYKTELKEAAVFAEKIEEIRERKFLADNVMETEDQNASEKLYKENVILKLYKENVILKANIYYITKLLDEKNFFETKSKITKRTTKIYFPPLCQRS